MQNNELIEALRNCEVHGNGGDCRKECPYVDQDCGACNHEALLHDAANAIEMLIAEYNDMDLQLQHARDVIAKRNDDVQCQRRHMIDLAKKLPKWISVEERMPPDSGDVIIYTVSDVVGVGCYLPNRFVGQKGRWVQWYSGGGIGVSVTHWMPLPDAPEVDE